MKKIIITKRNTDGSIVDIDVSKKFFAMTDEVFERLKKATAEAGKGELLSWTEKSGDVDLKEKAAEAAAKRAEIARKRRSYSNVMNEGAEGYNPY